MCHYDLEGYGMDDLLMKNDLRNVGYMLICVQRL